MPSPLGHAIAGATVGWAIAPTALRPGRAAHAPLNVRAALGTAAVYAALGMLPDIDLLVGMHRGPTHSLGAALLAGLALAALTRRADVGVAGGAAYATHALLDWLAIDTSPPFGLMALWPLTDRFYYSGLEAFAAISRRYWLPGFWEQNLRALGWELLVLVPFAALVFVARRQRPRAA